ncbi:hypothetical protein P691DRAFT_805708 [Macrolepiota fuliginosa MF-IS2]|uniref:Uncharacterized protein n=1 Tax=Macrolepiota fuliginosa MF-IS2 TaxID=1400762 RepID=A0A9P5X8P5_9AGAR|nr:hypothetical protein P691DRAFT_805708 [Macrolepiota fuliginosa MF-IS2]
MCPVQEKPDSKNSSQTPPRWNVDIHGRGRGMCESQPHWNGGVMLSVAAKGVIMFGGDCPRWISSLTRGLTVFAWAATKFPSALNLLGDVSSVCAQQGVPHRNVLAAGFPVRMALGDAYVVLRLLGREWGMGVTSRFESRGRRGRSKGALGRCWRRWYGFNECGW